MLVLIEGGIARSSAAGSGLQRLARRRRIAGGIAGLRARARARSGAWRRIAARGRVAQPRRLERRPRSSAILRRAASAPTSVRGGWPGSSAEPAQRSGRCSGGTGSRAGARGQRQTLPAATNGREPGALLHMDVKRLARFSVPGHWATGDRAEQHAQPRHRLDLPALSSSTTTAARSTSSYTPTKTPTPTPRTLERALAHFAELGLTRPQAVMTDNAHGLPQLAPLPGRPRRRRRPPHPHPALHAALERQGRKLHPNTPRRMGLQPHRWQNSQQRARRP